MQWQFDGRLTEEQLEAIAELCARWIANEIGHKKEETTNKEQQ